MDFLVTQFLSGLSSASSLFLVASGLSIIFGVMRIVNFAHGSFYMLGAYIAYTFAAQFGESVLGFWLAIVCSALVVGLLGALLEMTLLRRIYQAPELFQLVATFGVVLIVEDLVPMIWGAEDLLGPRAPGLEGAVDLMGQHFPVYDIVLILLGPLVLGGLWLLFYRTRWGVLVRAATEDREMVASLGVNQAWLFTSVFTLGAFLAALGGAVQLPREAVHHLMDLQIIVEVFMVVVIGGLGSVPGAFLAAVLIAELNAFGILVFPEITLVLAFLVMAVVLVIRPWGLFGKDEGPPRAAAEGTEQPIRPFSPQARKATLALLLFLLLLPLLADHYLLSVGAEVLIFVLFAVSLHFMMGIGGMVSFGHAAYFGMGAYGAALLVKHLGFSMETALVFGAPLALVGAVVFGWFCVRLSGVYLAMLTLAFAQITWAVVFQWYGFTGGDNGLLGIWPSPWASDPAAFYYLTLAVCGGGVVLLRRFAFSPFGYGLRACRDSSLRSAAIGIHIQRQQWIGFALSGGFAGIAGALYAFLKGSVFPDTVSIPVSVDGLVMVLLGGVQTMLGPILGAGVYKSLHVFMSSYTDSWRLVMGVMIVALVMAFPQGLVGVAQAGMRLLSQSSTGEKA